MNTNELIYENNDKSILVSFALRDKSFPMLINHFHENYEVYCLLKGERKYHIKDKTYSLKDGDLIFINPYTLHRTLDSEKPFHERFLVNFTPEYFRIEKDPALKFLLKPFLRDNPIIRLADIKSAKAKDLIEEIRSEIKYKKTGFELYVNNLIFRLLLLAGRSISDKSNKTLIYVEPQGGKIMDIVRYINEEYMNHIDLESISRKFYISKYYLSRLFKETTGFNFTEYLSEIRVLNAQKHLRNTDYSISFISGETGFGCISQFGRIFKKITGQTPSSYRKEHYNKTLY